MWVINVKTLRLKTDELVGFNFSINFKGCKGLRVVVFFYWGRDIASIKSQYKTHVQLVNSKEVCRYSNLSLLF